MKKVREEFMLKGKAAEVGKNIEDKYEEIGPGREVYTCYEGQ